LSATGLEWGLRKEGCPTFAGAPVAKQLPRRNTHAGTRILMMGSPDSG